MPWDVSFDFPYKEDPGVSCGPAMRTSFLLISLVLFHHSHQRIASLPLASTPSSLSSQLPKLQELATWNLGQHQHFLQSRKFYTCMSQTPIGFFRNPDADEQSLLFRAAFSWFSTCAQEGVGESQQLPCPAFQAWESDVCKRRLGYLVFQQQSKTDVVGSGWQPFPLAFASIWLSKIMIQMCLYFYHSDLHYSLKD